jgi:hypothetical protein
MRASLGGAWFAALTLVAGAACGSSTHDREEYVDALVEAFGEEDNTAFSDEERTCFAEAVVDSIGLDRLQDELSPDEARERGSPRAADLGVEVSEAMGREYFERLSVCTDIRQLLIRAVAGGEAVSPEVTDCIETNLDDSLLEQVVTVDFIHGDGALQEDEELAGRFQAAFTDCMGG